MDASDRAATLGALRQQSPEKFASQTRIFERIHRGDRIFVGTGCGEPQYLVQALVQYVQSHPKVIFDAEVFHVWTLGVAPYTESKFRQNFRHNSFFVGTTTRDAVNAGAADYTPVFLSGVPELFRRGLVAIDAALIQTSLPDRHGYLSLGVSVDIVKAAAQHANLVIAQVNANMPRVHGDSFIHIDDIDFLVPHDERLLEYHPDVDRQVAPLIGEHVARRVQDGDTIQVGYGALPNAILANLKGKRHLGVHSELLSDGIVELMREGVIDDSRKTVLRGKTVAAFCMGSRETYEYLDDNPAVEFRPIDYTNSPLNIARNANMVAINTGLEIDLICIAIPAKATLGVVRQCAERGVRSAAIITSGFSEIGNLEEERRIVSAAREHGMRVLGPNIFGVYSSVASLNATFGPRDVAPGNVAILTQSGALGIAMMGKTHTERIGLSAIVSVGNKADVDEADLLEYLIADESTRVVLMYVEGVKHGERLVRMLRQTTARKPVVVLKSGRSQRGALDAASHTGSLAGADNVFSDIMRQCGVLRASSIEEALEWCKFLASAPAPRGENAVILTNGGGIGVLAADACEQYGVRLFDDIPKLGEAFHDAVPDFGSTKNPVDITGQATLEDYRRALDAAVRHEDIHSVICLGCETAVLDTAGLTATVEGAFDASGAQKPMVFSFVGGVQIDRGISELRRRGVPIYGELDQAISCLGALYTHTRHARTASVESCDSAPMPDLDIARVDEATRCAREEGRTFLLAHEAADVMAAAGVPMPESAVVRTLDGALSTAERLGYPVVLKIVSKDILHKSDAGGVALDLESESEVIDAYQAILVNARRYRADAVIEGVEVTQMIRPGTETIVGARRDPAFGSIVMFGLGGVYVEVLKDVAFRALPLDRDAVLAMIGGIRAHPILFGVRGEEPRDVQSLCDCILKVSAILQRCEFISDREVNPLMVYEQGRGVRAVGPDPGDCREGGVSMKPLIVASTRRSAGKTSLIAGIAKALGARIGYAKPFGDRLLYRKKRLWDYDAALMASVFGLEPDPQDMTIGFDHSKLRYMYDREAAREKVVALADAAAMGRDMLFLEAGSDCAYGTSVALDAVSRASYVEDRVLIVASGSNGIVLDDLLHVARHEGASSLAGVIVNKVADVEDFRTTYGDAVEEAGIPLLGTVPYVPEMTRVSMDYLAEALFAKTVAGADGLSNVVENVLVGAMSTNEVLRAPVFAKPSKLVITSGDRSDMILAALETDTAGIVLTNNILPPANVIAKATERRVPMLLVTGDTFQTAKLADDMEPLLTASSADKTARLERLAREHIRLDELTRVALG
ncbi:hypothetical protein FJZ36_12835 [Candidatus Poribacteria bacterium]|nr:hypothetical protein [Candidatus Poribacteria bacterium]